MVPVSIYNRMIAPNGYYYNDTTSTRTGNISGLLIESDAVFTSIIVEGEEKITEWNLAGKTVTNDVFPPANKYITSYELASGIVLEIL